MHEKLIAQLMQLKKLTASELSLLFIFTVTVVYYSINIHEVICGQSSRFSWISFWSAGVVFIQTTCWASAVRVVNTNIHQKYNRERNYRELLFGYLGMHHLKQMHGSVLFHNWNKRSHWVTLTFGSDFRSDQSLSESLIWGVSFGLRP